MSEAVETAGKERREGPFGDEGEESVRKSEGRRRPTMERGKHMGRREGEAGIGPN